MGLVIPNDGCTVRVFAITTPVFQDAQRLWFFTFTWQEILRTPQSDPSYAISGSSEERHSASTSSSIDLEQIFGAFSLLYRI